ALLELPRRGERHGHVAGGARVPDPEHPARAADLPAPDEVDLVVVVLRQAGHGERHGPVVSVAGGPDLEYPLAVRRETRAPEPHGLRKATTMSVPGAPDRVAGEEDESDQESGGEKDHRPRPPPLPLPLRLPGECHREDRSSLEIRADLRRRAGFEKHLV